MGRFWVHILTLMLAVSSLGLIIGWFVGQSGADSVVLAAVLPAILSIGGGFIVFRVATRNGSEDHNHGIATNLSVFLFTAFLFFGTLIGNYSKWKADSDLTWRYKYFRDCSEMELRINAGRKSLELDPLKSETFCK